MRLTTAQGDPHQGYKYKSGNFSVSSADMIEPSQLYSGVAL